MKKLLSKYAQVLSYLFFGVLTTLLNIVLYTVFQAVFGYSAANSWGNVLDNCICILFAYATNRRWVFQSHTTGREARAEFEKFVACRLGTMLLDAVVMIVGGNWLGAAGAQALRTLTGSRLTEATAQKLWGIGVKVFSNGLVIVLNYVFSKCIVFKGKKQK